MADRKDYAPRPGGVYYNHSMHSEGGNGGSQPVPFAMAPGQAPQMVAMSSSNYGHEGQPGVVFFHPGGEGQMVQMPYGQQPNEGQMQQMQLSSDMQQMQQMQLQMQMHQQYLYQQQQQQAQAQQQQQHQQQAHQQQAQQQQQQQQQVAQQQQQQSSQQQSPMQAAPHHNNQQLHFQQQPASSAPLSTTALPASSLLPPGAPPGGQRRGNPPASSAQASRPTAQLAPGAAPSLMSLLPGPTLSCGVMPSSIGGGLRTGLLDDLDGEPLDLREGLPHELMPPRAGLAPSLPGGSADEPVGAQVPAALPAENQPASGIIFGCTSTTYDECHALSMVGLPRKYLPLVHSIVAGYTLIFLFNFSDRQLHGAYIATSHGQENMSLVAWRGTAPSLKSSSGLGMELDDGDGSPFPAQCTFAIVEEFAPVPEVEFRHILEYTERQRFKFKLSRWQCRDLIETMCQYDAKQRARRLLGELQLA